MRRVRQPNDWYCGPAVLEMMASHWNLIISQEEFVQAADVTQKIRQHGMLLSELALAVSVTMPDHLFWYKRNASMGELSSLVNMCGYPVGVEWQGIFDGDEDEEEEDEQNGDDDAGHYCVVTGMSTADNWLTMADPYHNRGIDRQLTVLEFKRRWWDINDEQDVRTGKWRQIDDYHALFVITTKDDAAPELFGMMNAES